MKKNKQQSYIKKLYGRKIIKWVLIPFILLTFWFLLSLILITEKSFSVLQYQHDNNGNNTFSEKRLLKGEKIKGEFTASEDNLGIISVRFGNVPQVSFNNQSRILFKIKEKTATSWFYTNTYRSGLIRPNRFTTLGFIPIQNSRDKVYTFEITSLNGNSKNAIQVSSRNPVYLSMYKFTKDDIFKNKESMWKFSANMVYAFFANIDVLIESSIFLLPFIFYMTWIGIVHDQVRFRDKNGKHIIPLILSRLYKKRKKIFTYLVILGICADVLLFQIPVAGIIIGLSGLWVFVVYVNNYQVNKTFIFAFILISLAVIATYFKFPLSIDIVTTYAYIFIIIGLMQILVAYKKLASKN